jgi:hypothetical protein
MGVSSRLFYDAGDAEKQTLYRRCTLSEDQLDEQMERWNDLAEFLIDDLSRQTGHETDKWLQGSYKFRTQIRPLRTSGEFDIDLGFYFICKKGTEASLKDHAYFKEEVRKSITRFAKSIPDEVTGDVEAKPRCIRLHYVNHFHIDVPVYVRYESDLSVMLAGAEDWEESDPKAVYRWYKKTLAPARRAIARRHIKYLKLWTMLRLAEDVRLTSIVITVLVSQIVARTDIKYLEQDDDAFRLIVAEIAEQLSGSPSVKNPANTAEDLNRLGADKTEDLVGELSKLQILAERALGHGSELQAADAWQEVFAHHFPFPEVVEVDSKGTPVAGQSGLPAVVFTPEVEIIATPRNNAAGPRIRGVNGINAVPKDCSLTFRLLNASALPSGSTVSWIVRNEGLEAELKNDLGHENKPGIVTTDRTAYKGKHHMDCMVRKDGFLIGLRRVPVQIIGISMPLRNAVKNRWRSMISAKR